MRTRGDVLLVSDERGSILGLVFLAKIVIISRFVVFSYDFF